MKTITSCIFTALALFFVLAGCNLTRDNPARETPSLEFQLSAIDDSAHQRLHTREIDEVVHAELSRSQKLVCFTAISLSRGIGETRNNNVEFENFEGRSLIDGIVGVDFYFVFQNDKEFVLISNLFIPHIDNYRPMSSLNSTNGFYVLRIKRTDDLAKQVESALRKFGGDGARIQGGSQELEEAIKALYGRGIRVQGVTHDGARIDVIEANYGTSHVVRHIINPIRPTDSKEAYVDMDVEAADALFRILWSHFM